MVFKILHIGEKSLQETSLPVTDDDFENISSMIDEMFETMYSNNGIGLAAPQIGINKRFVIIDIDGLKKYVMINPIINSIDEEKEKHHEGCLSLPGGGADVERPKTVTVTWIDLEKNIHTETFSGLMAVCVQHEIDHLDGILFIDHLSRLKKSMVIKKVNKHLE